MFGLSSAIITSLIILHMTFVIFSIYVHRGKGHHLFIFNSGLEHFFRFWMWLVMQYSWENWMQHYAAQHRKHHKYSDTILDPHSPHQLTIKQMFDYKHNEPGRPYYISLAEMQIYAPDVTTITDWIELNVYSKYQKAGTGILWVLLTIMFGIPGLVIGAFFYFLFGPCTILLANYGYHKIGFTYAGAGNIGGDKSKIFFPGLFGGGEVLHAHHHNDPTIPYFNRYWWEIDTGWLYCRVLIAMKLMKLTNSTST